MKEKKRERKEGNYRKEGTKKSKRKEEQDITLLTPYDISS